MSDNGIQFYVGESSQSPVEIRGTRDGLNSLLGAIRQAMSEIDRKYTMFTLNQHGEEYYIIVQECTKDEL